MPAIATVMSWMLVYPEFLAQYGRACEARSHLHAEDALDVADDAKNDFVDRTTRSGAVVRVLDREHVERSKLRIETRLKLMTLLNPKRFGAKLDVNHTGTISLEGLIRQSITTPITQAIPTIEHDPDAD